jgi:rfaE bifunctional protein nucleotidyltransferase chain/domain
MRPCRGRVVSEAEMLREVAAHRAAGRTVAMTNGGFDLLHVGHVRMLAEAAALADLLVVAVNDDGSVRASKGAGRPVVPVAERAEIVASLPGVDLVVVFGDRTMDRLLEAARPDVHVKGRDYAEATHPEAATDRALGVRMAFVGDEKAHGAGDLAARLRAPAVRLDRVETLRDGSVRGLALRGKAAVLAPLGLADLASILATREGREVHRHRTRWVRRVEVAGEAVYVKAEHPARRGATALDEMRHHLALRAAGFRAPEPWLALEGKADDGRAARALVTREARGPALDAFLRERLPGASGRERAAWARGLGLFLRAFHTARFLDPDLLAHHLVVDGDPASGAAALQPIDLARVTRARSRVTPKETAPGLAALALSLAPVTSPRFRLAVLRAYLGGSLADSLPWRKAILARERRVEGRGTFRDLAGRAP